MVGSSGMWCGVVWKYWLKCGCVVMYGRMLAKRNGFGRHPR